MALAELIFVIGTITCPEGADKVTGGECLPVAILKRETGDTITVTQGGCLTTDCAYIVDAITKDRVIIRGEDGNAFVAKPEPFPEDDGYGRIPFENPFAPVDDAEVDDALGELEDGFGRFEDEEITDFGEVE